MTDTPRHPGSSCIPCLRYHDAPAAIEWLCSVFGFERHLVVPGDGDTIRHAELRSSQGLLMLGSVDKAASASVYQRLMTTPGEAGGANTQGIYLVVPDADAVYAKVQAAGVPIDQPIVDEPYGGRGFTCRDLEGHVWSIGSYDPWAKGSE